MLMEEVVVLVHWGGMHKLVTKYELHPLDFLCRLLIEYFAFYSLKMTMEKIRSVDMVHPPIEWNLSAGNPMD